MAISTPRGLKVRLEPEDAFGLMGRLGPQVSPYRILKTTEGVEIAPEAWGDTAVVLAIIGGAEPVSIFLAGAVVHLLVSVYFTFGPFVGAYLPRPIPIRWMVGLGTLYTYMMGYGLFLVGISLLGLLLVGWQAVVAYLAAMVATKVTAVVLDFLYTRTMYRRTGTPLTRSEGAFFAAFTLHATRVGADPDPEVTAAEQNSGRVYFVAYASQHPEVRRFGARIGPELGPSPEVLRRRQASKRESEDKPLGRRAPD